MNKYLLMKDLPYIKAGTEYVKPPHGCYYIPTMIPSRPGIWENHRFFLGIKDVEDNQKWFKKIR